MRPPQFAAKEEIAATCFANDSYLWLYHIGDDINYFRDPKSLDLIRRINSINSIKKDRYNDYTYVDTDGISCNEQVARVRRYNKGSNILLKSYRYVMDDTTVLLDEHIQRATAVMYDGERYDLDVRDHSFQLPKEMISLILLETA